MYKVLSPAPDMQQALHPCLLLLLSRRPSLALGEPSEKVRQSQHRMKPLVMPMTSTSVWWCRLLQKERLTHRRPSRNALSPEGGSRFFAQLTLNSRSWMPGRLFFLWLPSFSVSHSGILLVCLGSCFSLPESWLHPDGPHHCPKPRCSGFCWVTRVKSP